MQTPPRRREIENDRLTDSLALPGPVAFRRAVPNHDIAPRGSHAAVRAKAPDTRVGPSKPVSVRPGGQADRRLNKALQLTRLIPLVTTSQGC
jgi:hypothetical protein